MRADVRRFSLADPSDVSGLAAVLERGLVEADQIVAVIGKTHGNGLVNDYTRGYLTLSLSLLISRYTGETPEAVRERVPFIFSGGVEGVLSPHYVVFSSVSGDPPGAAAGNPMALAIGVATTPLLVAQDIGRQRQIDLTAEAVGRAIAAARIEAAADVHFVQVKGPAFTAGELAEAAPGGGAPASDDPGKLMAYGRAASALGVAQALGEATADRAAEAAVLRDLGCHSAVASVSAGVEVRVNEVVVLGMSRHWSGPLAIGHAPLQDALDVTAIHRLLVGLGFPDRHQLEPAEARRIRATFVKCEPQRDGLIRGRPHTMLNDGDMDRQRHIRGAVGAVTASILNETALFVSGGAEHQGPDGGGLIALIVEREDAHG